MLQCIAIVYYGLDQVGGLEVPVAISEIGDIVANGG